MNLKCPKCDSTKIMKRKAVPRSETHTTRFVGSIGQSIQIAEPQFYICYNCWNKFNIK